MKIWSYLYYGKIIYMPPKLNLFLIYLQLLHAVTTDGWLQVGQVRMLKARSSFCILCVKSAMALTCASMALACASMALAFASKICCILVVWSRCRTYCRSNRLTRRSSSARKTETSSSVQLASPFPRAFPRRFPGRFARFLKWKNEYPI